MKYRQLTLEELSELETDFARFLAANGIPADHWEKLKSEDSPKVQEFMETFSDIVFQQVLDQVRYLEHTSPNEVHCFFCDSDTIHLLGIKTAEPADLDFSKATDWQAMMDTARQSGIRLQVFRASKAYHTERNLELFQMMENGAKISKDGLLYQTLENIVTSA
jgi:hypothetical protein